MMAETEEVIEARKNGRHPGITFRCDVCGMEYQTLRGMKMHRTKMHKAEIALTAAAAKAVKPYKPRQKPAVRLVEQWSDENGRIVLTDDDGGLWVAKKVDG
jgi:hypothetical protein